MLARMTRLAIVSIVVAVTLEARAHAADTKAVVAEIEAHDKAFLAAYDNGELKKMKSEIGKAVSLGEKNGLGSDAVMADTYVLAAIYDVDGNDDAKGGVRDFVKALKIKPDVAIPKGMATSPVKAALKQARTELGLLPKDGAAPAAATAKPAPADEEAQDKQPSEQKEKEKQAREEPEHKEQQKAQQAKQEQAKQEQAKQEQAKQEQAKQEQAKQEQAKQEQAKQEQAKQEQAKSEVAQKDKADKASKAESEKQTADLKGRVRELEKDKADRDKQLADAKTRIQQLEKDKADRDKQLADAKARGQQLERDKADSGRQGASKDKEVADAKTRIQQLEKQLGDARAHGQQLERERADLERQRGEKDKQVADLRAQESKEREALEKVTRDKQAAEAQARDAENKRKLERDQRERLFAGPDMPSHLREALTCSVPDEAPLRTDLFVHCVARPNVKARSIVFYYRAGSAHYYSVPMERTSRGWYAAIVPGVRVVGKVLQYYAEALDGREAVVANNGKENSPNILSLRPGGPRS